MGTDAPDESLDGEIAGGEPAPPLLRELVVCSLEVWDEVWRRNQFIVDALLRQKAELRVLFVEPCVDVAYEFLQRRRPARPGLRCVQRDQRLWGLRPVKVLPRAIAPGVTERHLVHSVRRAVQRLGFTHPVLWVNDSTYACLADTVPWPTVYDVTDDWLVADVPRRVVERRRAEDQALLRRAEEVVVVSPNLAATRGARRSLHVIPDAADLEHFRHPRARPRDLPAALVALYIGTLHEDRLDVNLCVTLAGAIAPARAVFVGPSSLSAKNTHRLLAAGCVLLGSRPYSAIPAYYQHADLLVVPHRVNPFTESLDPIKGYECLAVGRPTLSTPVAGLRDLGPPIETIEPALFAQRARHMLTEKQPLRVGAPPTWTERAAAFAKVLEAALHARPPVPDARQGSR